MLARALWPALFLLPSVVTAQQAVHAASPWSLRVRAVLSGNSYESEPAGYKLYSGLGLEAAVARRLGDALSVEVSLRTESREMEGPRVAGADHRLGSLEMLPVTAALLWLPRGRSGAALQPYLGAGVNLTATWEKSGALDSANIAPTVGPAIQLGADWSLTDRTTLDLDVRWHTMTVDIEDFGATVPSVKVDPLVLGLGLGVRF